MAGRYGALVGVDLFHFAEAHYILEPCVSQDQFEEGPARNRRPSSHDHTLRLMADLQECLHQHMVLMVV